MKFQAQQGLHDSHVSKQIQTVLSPFVLPICVSFFVIWGYRSVLNGLGSLTVDDGVGGSLVLKNDTNLTLGTTAWRPLDGLEEDLISQEKDLYESIVETSIENEINRYEAWENNTLTLLGTSLQNAMDGYQSQSDYISKIKSLFQTLNDTVLNELISKNSALATIQSEISDSVSIGSSIDVSGMSIDTTGISSDFETVFTGLSIANNTELLALNGSKETIVLSIGTIFETAIEKLEGYDYELKSMSSSSNTSMLSLLQVSSFSNTSNVSTNSSSSTVTNASKDPLKTTLIILGCVMVVVYMLISVLTHYQFQYTCQLRKEIYMGSLESVQIADGDTESTNNTDDVSTIDEDQCDTEKSVDVHMENNFNLMSYRLKSPIYTMVTDLLYKYTGNWYLTYWRVEYLMMRLPLLCICMVSVGVVWMSVLKAEFFKQSAVDLTDNSSSTETLMASAYIIELPSYEIKTTDMDMDDWNGFVSDLHENVTSSLQVVFEDYNITGVLSIDIPLSPLSSLDYTYSPLSQTYTMPNISLASQTSLQVVSSSVSIPTIVSSLIGKSVWIVKQAVIHTCVICLCTLGGVSLLVLFVGVAYSMVMG